MIWFPLTHYRMGMQASHKLGLMDLNEFMPKLRWNAILGSWHQANIIPWTSSVTYVRKRESSSKYLSLTIIPEHCYKRTRKPKGDIESHISKLLKVVCLPNTRLPDVSNCKCKILSSSIKDYRSHRDVNNKQILEK